MQIDKYLAVASVWMATLLTFTAFVEPRVPTLDAICLVLAAVNVWRAYVHWSRYQNALNRK